MGVLGEMLPSRTLRSEAGEAGDGQGWRLGPIDLDGGVVEVFRVETEVDSGADPVDGEGTPQPPHPRVPDPR